METKHPVHSFFKASEIWNKSKAMDLEGDKEIEYNTINLPIMDVKVLNQNNVRLMSNLKKRGASLLATLDKGTRFRILNHSNFFKRKYSRNPNVNPNQMRVEIVDGEHTGKSRFINATTLLLDERTAWRNQQKKK
ncbi:hypothetical protein [Microscilla marina]|uniref:Uncharacterized protein n=1 Tax=Microscilla marina ATCC 23134 TaxID=313606 RepID=A1ZVT4_MICM2|nr:hypothetical protein [Microscilla marina]EAY25511.1 hypothetical protein M23134_06210 [Microscilla marina ATCC 23134]